MDKELLLTRAGVVFCLVALGAFYLDVVSAVLYGRTSASEATVLAVLITALVYGSLVYLLARCGHVRRARGGAQLPNMCERIYEADVKTLQVCVLIPSYKEEIGVLRQTIVSAALAEFPSRRVVVLIDDPASTSSKEFTALNAPAK